ncbi:interleukin-17 receptor E-like protein isoform X2 [Lissotriton helveticus]
MKISTVMKCTGIRRCSLHLSVKGTLHLDESIRGVEICSLTLDTSLSQCVSVRLSRNETKKSNGQKVQLQYNCFEVTAAQQVFVTMKTIPNYCNVKLEQEYFVEDCRNEDLGNNVPACIVGKLEYRLDREKKSMLVHVSEFLEDKDYHVRLCHKWFSCQDIGVHALIKREDPLKSASLQYSELLPCLCVEGWSAFPDARRRQICPFKNDTQALWNGVVYNPVTQSLAWQSACPVQATVSLCQKSELDDKCLNLPNSLRSAVRKVEYLQVDAHALLCMKFTTQQGSWVRCPFAHGQFSGWQINMEVVADEVQLTIISQATATFSVIVYNKTQSSGDDLLHKLPSIQVDSTNSVKMNVSHQWCDKDSCIKGWRTDVQYSIPVDICDLPCPHLSMEHTDGGENYLLDITIAVISLILVTFVGMAGYITLEVHRRKQLAHEYSLKAKVQHISSGIASSLEQRVSILSANVDDVY